MWKTWNPDPQASQPTPVDWAAKAAEWAREQQAKAPPPPPPPAERYHDVVENETVMEDAMPTDTTQSNEWSAVTDPALEQYSSTSWNGDTDEQYQGYYNAEGYAGYKNENSGYAEQYYGADGAGAEGESFDASGYQAEYSQGYPNSQVPFTKHTEERGIPPPPTHTLPLGRGFREQPPIIQHSIQMGVVEAPRRKALPAWIRDGLNKMGKDKSKNPPDMELTRRPRTTDVTGYNKMISRGMTTAIQRNKISGYSVLQDSGASSDEKEDVSDMDSEVKPKMDPVLFVKRSLTELLLEATNCELRLVVMECLQQEQAIKQLDELCKKKENNGTNGLDLVSYNNQSSSDSNSSSESSSSESNKRKQTIPPTLPQTVLDLKLDSNKENTSSKRKPSNKENTSSKRKPSNSSPKPSRSRKVSESKPSKSEKVSSKSSEKPRKDSDDKSSNRKQKSSKKPSRSDEKHHSSDDDRKRKKSRRSSSSSDSKERSSRRSKHDKISKRNSSKKEEKSKKKEDRKSRKEEIPSKKEKIKELNKKIEKATREVEKKTTSSKKRPERSTSPSSSTLSSSSSDQKTKKKSKSVKKRENSSSRRRGKSSDSSDYGYKFSPTSPDKKHKTRKR